MSAGARHARAGAALLAVILMELAWAGEARAQPVRLLAVEDIDGFVEFVFDYERDRRTREDGRANLRLDDLEFQEVLNLDLEGYVYHPRFMVYRVGGELRTVQELLDEELGSLSRDQSNDRLLGGGHFDLNFLGQHPYSFQFFGDFRETQVDRRFSPSYDLSTEILGARFRYQPGPLPFEVSYRNWSREESGRGATGDSGDSGDAVSVSSRYQIWENSSGGLAYHWADEEVRGIASERHQFLASNRTRLGGGKDLRLDARYRNVEHLDREQTIYSGSSTFHWPLTRTLTSQYNARLERQDFDDGFLNTWNADARFSHRLYGSLTSTFRIAANFQDASFGDVRRYRAEIDEGYRKRLGSWGRLSIGLAPYVEWQQRRPTQTEGFVVDEPHALADSIPVELGQLEVDPTTVVVTDAAGTLFFVEDLDYTLTVRGAAVEITRLPTGDIGEGETVLVDYQYRLAGSGDIRTTGFSSTVNLSLLDWTDFYWRFRSIDQDDVSGDLDTRLQTSEQHVVGLRLSRDWLGARFGAGLEYEQDDRDFETIGVRLAEDVDTRSARYFSQWISVSTPRLRGWRGEARVHNRFTDYPDADQEVSSLSVTASAFGRVTRRGTLELTADYLRERWDAGRDLSLNDIDALAVTASFLWRYRSLQIRVGARSTRLDRRREEEDEDTFFVRVRREL